MKAVAISNVQVEASATLTPDNAITIQILLTVPGASDGPRVSIGSQQHWITPADAAAIVEAPVTDLERALGLSLRDLLVARALVVLHQQSKLLLLELIPEALRPVAA